MKRHDLCYFDDYRSPNTDPRLFKDMLGVLLECVSKEKELCYSVGDFNINILNYDSHSATANFVDLHYVHSFLPLIYRPTRITQNSTTIIDNIFTNTIGELECGRNGILVTDLSDHFPIFHIEKILEKWKLLKLYISARNY